MPLSTTKVVISGNVVETYKFERPILYGVEISKKTKKKCPRRLFGLITESNVYATRSRLRRLMQANASQYFKPDGLPFKPIFITYTFKENLTKLTYAHTFFKKFILRLNYFVYDEKCSRLRYLAVPEFQKRGAVHYHCVFFNLPYIDRIYDEMQRVWGQGFCIVKTINNDVHLVNYVSKYFTKEALDSRLVGRKKYFCSKGLFKPLINREELFSEFILNDLKEKKPDVSFEYVQDYTANLVSYNRYNRVDSSFVKLFLAMDSIS